MANTILIKRSNVPDSVPGAGNLVPGELALNYSDGNLFFKDSTDQIVLLVSTQFVNVSGDVTAGGNLTTGEALILQATGLSYTGFAAPDAVASNVIYKLPAADGSFGESLKTDGAGNLSWAGTATGAITVSTRDSGNILVDTFNGFLNVIGRNGSVPVPLS
jgi:hypothetical protein